jgi:ABC-type multidrug transport system fused ATPase/permease subunit
MKKESKKEELENLKTKKPIQEEAKSKLLYEKKNINLIKFILHISSCFEIFLMIVGCIGYMGAGLADPLIALLMGDTINKFIKINSIESGDITKSQYQLLMKEFMHITDKMVHRFLYVGAICFLSNFLGGMTIGYIGLRQIHRLKEKYFKLILEQEQSWFDEKNSYEICTKVQMQLEQIELGLGDKYGLVVLNFTKICAGLTISFISSWKLTLVIIALFPFSIIFIIYLLFYLTDLPILIRKSYEIAGGIAEEILYNIKTVSSFANFDFELKRFNNEINNTYSYEIENSLKTAICLGALIFFSLTSDMVAVLYGKKLISEQTWNSIRKERFEAGHVITILFCISSVMTSLRLITPSFRIIRNSVMASSDYFTLLDRKLNMNLSDSNLKPNIVSGKIEFKNINFSYPNSKNKKVLNDLNFIIESGKKIAFVGESGCGKSTIVNLIERLYEPDSGEILLDGVNIKNIDLKYLRSLIGHTEQEPILFNQSIRENIIFGRKNEINKLGNLNNLLIEASKEALVDEFVKNIEGKYDYIVGIKGSKLSGGQKQRIAIARAILCKPKILILDEATSALDNESEKKLQNNLDNITKKNVTTIIIAHRLSTIKNADLIYVMSDGKICEQGNHNELYNKNGIYTNLIKKQKEQDEIKKKLKSFFDTNEVKDEKIESGVLINKQRIVENERKYAINLLKIFKLMKDNKFGILIGTLFSLIHGATNPFIGYVLAKSIIYMSDNDINIINKKGKFWGLMLLVLAFAQSISFSLKLWKLNSSGSLLVYNIRKAIMQKYLEMHMSFFDEEENSPGALFTKLTLDTMYFNSITLIFFGDFPGTIGAFFVGNIWSLTINWKLTLISICFLPFIIGAKIYIHKARRGGREANRKINIEAGSILSECVINTKTIFSFNFEKEAVKMYTDIIKKETLTFLRDSFLQGFIVGIGVMAQYSCNATLFHLSAKYIKNGSLTFSEMTLCIYIIIYTIEGISNALLGIGDYEKISNSYDSIYKTLNLKSEINPLEYANQGKTSAINIKGEIEFKDVSFAYPTKPDHKILDNVSFKINSGQSVALVGYSGSGKTTIIELIERFYDINEGEILIDGINITKYNLFELRKRIGLVEQEPILFKRTPFENIKYGNLMAKDVDIYNVAKQAKIEQLSGEIRKGVSGGEKQRIAIARTFLKNPKILLFDEATSALDKETEIEIQKSIYKYQDKKTNIIVAHRLNTIINSDLILVFKKGKLIEKGTHQELIALDKTYAFLYNNSEK